MVFVNRKLLLMQTITQPLWSNLHASLDSVPMHYLHMMHKHITGNLISLQTQRVMQFMVFHQCRFLLRIMLNVSDLHQSMCCRSKSYPMTCMCSTKLNTHAGIFHKHAVRLCKSMFFPVQYQRSLVFH